VRPGTACSAASTSAPSARSWSACLRSLFSATEESFRSDWPGDNGHPDWAHESRANSGAMRAQQRPTYEAPFLTPMRSGPDHPSRHDLRRKPSGPWLLLSAGGEFVGGGRAAWVGEARPRPAGQPEQAGRSPEDIRPQLTWWWRGLPPASVGAEPLPSRWSKPLAGRRPDAPCRRGPAQGRPG
jgi:hypothetical protein